MRTGTLAKGRPSRPAKKATKRRQPSRQQGSKTREERLVEHAHWAPQPKQEAALCRPEFEVGFGGARGGGKTDAGIAWLGYDSDHPRLRGLVVRKNSVDLGEWLLRAKEIHPKLRITGNPPILHFPGKGGDTTAGATYFTGHMKDKDSFSKYVGQNLPRILWEELNLIPSEEQYERVASSCRSTIPGIAPQIFSTFNSDNVGHTWIKRRFRLAGVPRDNVITKDERTGRMRIFIPATVDDNKVLVENDPDYIHFLEGLPDGLREQWRWGSWDDPILKGAYYTFELAQMRRESRICDLPYQPELSVHTWWDIGADTTAIIFVQFVDNYLHIIDFYMNDSLGFPFYLAKLQELRENRGYTYGIHHFPHDLDRMEWGSGRNRKEVLESRRIDYEVGERPRSKQNAIDAARLLFGRAKIDQRNCQQLLDALLNYRKKWDEEKQTFHDEPVHDWASHPADAFSYIALSNHAALVPEKKTEIPRSARLRRETGDRDGLRPPSAEFGGDIPGINKSRFNYD